MRNRDSFKKAAKAVMLSICFACAAAFVFLPVNGVSENKNDFEQLGLGDFVSAEITYNGVMHEIYWHYELANQMIIDKKYEDAKAHLRMLNFYLNLLPYVKRNNEFFKNPEDVKKFDDWAIKLLKSIDGLSASLGKGDYSAAGKVAEENTSKICHYCHDLIDQQKKSKTKTRIREITPFGKSITMKGGLTAFLNEEMTYDGVMHELYWHYEFANQMMQVQRIEDVKAHLRLMSFYLDLLPTIGKNEKIFAKPEDVTQFETYVTGMKKAVADANAAIGKSDPAQAGRQMADNVSKMCKFCHDKLKNKKEIRDPTPYGRKMTMGEEKKDGE